MEWIETMKIKRIEREKEKGNKELKERAGEEEG